MRYQDELIQRAKAQDAPRMKEHYQSQGDQTSLMARDGERVAKLDFDSVFSQKHITKDTESVLTGNGISTVDPRRNLVRPSSLDYGSSIDGQPVHRVSTSYGPRRILPARSFMKCVTLPARKRERDQSLQTPIRFRGAPTARASSSTPNPPSPFCLSPLHIPVPGVQDWHWHPWAQRTSRRKAPGLLRHTGRTRTRVAACGVRTQVAASQEAPCDSFASSVIDSGRERASHDWAVLVR